MPATYPFSARQPEPSMGLSGALTAAEQERPSRRIVSSESVMGGKENPHDAHDTRTTGAAPSRSGRPHPSGPAGGTGRPALGALGPGGPVARHGAALPVGPRRLRVRQR